MYFIATLYVLATAQTSSEGSIPLADYRPAFVPQALRDGRCEDVSIAGGSIRGRRPVYSRWTVQRPFLTVVHELRRDIQMEASIAGYDDEILGRRGLLTAYRKLPDRVIEIFLQKGRIVKTKGPNYTGEERRDYEEYVTAMVTERPLYVGPKPRTWLPAAAKADALPSKYPGVPLPGLSWEPDAWSCSTSATGHRQYWATWYVPQPPSVAFPRILRAAERTGDWIVGPVKELDDARLSPKSRGRLLWLTLSRYRVDPPDVPANVTPVTISWSDPPRR